MCFNCANQRYNCISVLANWIPSRNPIKNPWIGNNVDTVEIVTHAQESSSSIEASLLAVLKQIHLLTTTAADSKSVSQGITNRERIICT